jgi:hypothetical protein
MWAARAHVEGDLYLRRKFRANGGGSLLEAEISGQLAALESRLINCSSLRVGSTVVNSSLNRLSDAHQLDGRVVKLVLGPRFMRTRGPGHGDED